MSKWFEVEADEIDIDANEREVSFFAINDDQGRIYLTVSFDQIKVIYNKIASL